MMLFWYESGVKAKIRKKERFEEISCKLVRGVCELIYLVKFLLYFVLALPLPVLWAVAAAAAVVAVVRCNVQAASFEYNNYDAHFAVKL